MTMYELHEKRSDIFFVLKKIIGRHPEEAVSINIILKEIDEMIESFNAMLDESSVDPENG